MQIYFRNRDEWRNWLVENHNTEKEIWLVFYKKKSGVQCVNYEEAVCEALCFGWIDSLLRSVDSEKYIQKFSPRRENSKWSDTNKKRMMKLIKEGSMADAGLKYFNFDLDELERDLENPGMKKKIELPEEYLEKIEQDTDAFTFYTKMPPSHRNQYAAYIMEAKKEETRLKRLARVIETLKANKHRLF